MALLHSPADPHVEHGTPREFCAVRPGAGQADYPLSRDAAEHTRLAEQAAFWAPDCRAFFDSVPIQPGQHVADLGCGTSHVAEALADAVGPRGRVLAVDIDPGLTDLLQQAAAARPAIQPWRCDAFATGWPARTLDAVHARFLAAPTGRLEELVSEMARLVRPGGWLLLQEPLIEPWQVPAAGADWVRLKASIAEGFARRGGDFNAGARLAPALRAAGATRVHARTVTHELPGSHPYARLPLAFGRSLAATWRDTGLLADADQRALLRTVEAALETNAPCSTFALVQVAARMP
jgi:SAM-dependent methyltransferase